MMADNVIFFAHPDYRTPEERPEVTVEPVGATWRVGIRLPSGAYDPDWRPLYTFSEREALSKALIISGQTGLVIRQHDSTPDFPPEAA